MCPKVTTKNQNFSISANGKVLDLSTPVVMGIINLTPDSFYANSRVKNFAKLLKLTEKMVDHGAKIIDLGAVSTRPGSGIPDELIEINRLLPPLRLMRATFPELFISVDTFRPQVALAASESGADLINDVYAGLFDKSMLPVVASTGLPYLLMHMKGTPSTMQVNPVYKNVVKEVLAFLSERISCAESSGIKQILIDPGFGFGKNLEDNYRLLKNLAKLQALGKPVLAGLSRKSMVHKILAIKPGRALNGTTVMNTLALLNGANILRVHDAHEAEEVVRLINFYKSV